MKRDRLVFKFFCFLILGGFHYVCTAQVNHVKVDMNTQHIVGDIEEFDREKYITIHASLSSDWAGDHVVSDIRKDFLKGYDVYLGRETGGLKGALNAVKEDPNRPGFADVTDIQKMGAKFVQSYQRKPNLFGYEKRLNNMMIGAQFHPIWPEGKLTRKGWALSESSSSKEPFGTASGEFMAHYLKSFYPTGEMKKPRFIEVINEPMWDLVPKKNRGIAEKEEAAVAKMAEFHSTVAHEIKKINPDVLVGGFTCAFPDFEQYDFKRWEYRWKKFIDLTGDDMDFWSLHFYDFPCKQKYENGKLSYIKKYRKGSNLKASLDMLEQYSMIKFGKIKPMVISEYSVQAHRYRDLAWTPWRDFLYVKSANAMLMTFMEHSESVAMAIPFFMLKCEWGRTKDGHPYRSRLFRQQFEKKGESGEQWVYSDLVQFYQLWSDVKGKRIAIESNNIDIQTQAFVAGKKMYVILNNLSEQKQSIALDVLNPKGYRLKSIKVKHHYAPYKSIEVEREGKIEESVFKNMLDNVVLEAEGTMVLEYSFQKSIKIAEAQEEFKYYSKEYYQSIEANTELNFTIDSVVVNQCRNAVLRVGVGRNHDKSLKPRIQINGKSLEYSEVIAGDLQEQRDRFYGVLEIPIPVEYLTKNNHVSIGFPDNGGHVASVTMKVYNKKNK